jgi:hypothetical protein
VKQSRRAIGQVALNDLFPGQKKGRHFRAAKFREETSKKANKANWSPCCWGGYIQASRMMQELFCSAASLI